MKVSRHVNAISFLQVKFKSKETALRIINSSVLNYALCLKSKAFFLPKLVLRHLKMECAISLYTEISLGEISLTTLMKIKQQFENKIFFLAIRVKAAL